MNELFRNKMQFYQTLTDANEVCLFETLLSFLRICSLLFSKRKATQSFILWQSKELFRIDRSAK